MSGTPAVLAAASEGKVFSDKLRYKLVKSTLPSRNPIGGMITSLTSEVVILPNAAPMTKPTARSTTFPRIANSLKSESIDMVQWPPCELSSSCHIAIESSLREGFMPRHRVRDPKSRASRLPFGLGILAKSASDRRCSRLGPDETAPLRDKPFGC